MMSSVTNGSNHNQSSSKLQSLTDHVQVVQVTPESACPAKNEPRKGPELSGRERLKRHRAEMAGRVWIPDVWGQEGLLKDWADNCTTFDAIRSSSLLSARAALVQEGRIRTNSSGLENSC